MNLENKVVIVTGAAFGIGKGIALRFAQENSKVVMADINIDELKKSVKWIQSDTGNDNIIDVKCDVSDNDDIEKLISKTLSKFGRIDILVNNAGIYPFNPIENITDKEWDRVINVNLKSLYLLSKAVLPSMKENGGGKIVNIASIAGTTVGYDSLVHYSSSKGGVQGFTKALAMEFAKHKINVNAISPGAIQTEGTRDLPDEQSEAIIQMIPLARWGQPKDIANLTAFLASDQADFITGQNIICDGGQTTRP